MLSSTEEVRQKITAGKSLLLAGEEALFRDLPKGNRIGGTIPYFMGVNGGVQSDSRIFVNELPEYSSVVKIKEYEVATLPSICEEAPENGFSVLLMPSGSPVHTAYAEDFPRYAGAFLKPVVGWISGVNLSDLGKRKPKVFAGNSGKASDQSAVVMHVSLAPEKLAEIDIVNVFRPGPGDAIMFSSAGFSAGECRINGRAANLARCMNERHIDFRLPLTANYNGSIVNVSVQPVDAEAGIVKFYAPVFAGLEYKFAKPVDVTLPRSTQPCRPMDQQRRSPATAS